MVGIEARTASPMNCEILHITESKERAFSSQALSLKEN
jgi:hypothetical protein